MLDQACTRVHSAGAVWFRGGMKGKVSKQEAQAEKEVAGLYAVGTRVQLQKKGTKQHC